MTFFGDLMLVVILLGLLTFVIVYSVITPWWRSAAGRHVMAFMFVAFVVVTIRVSRMVFGEYAAAPTLRGCGLFLVALVVWWRVSLVLYVQLRPSRREKKVHEVQS